MKKRVYLDAAAAHPVRASARRAFMRALSRYGNPSAPHEEGRQAHALLESARTRIAREVGAKPEAIIFTSGATESNALAIVGYVKARLKSGAWPEDIRVMYSTTQHASVIGAIEEVQALGATVTPIPLAGMDIDWGKFALALHEGVALVTLDVVCGETGVRFDTRRVRTLIDALPSPNRPVFHVDATQAPLTETMERTRLGADLISCDAQKVGGVRGIGVLVAPHHIPLLPLVSGGGQERQLRSGTPSPALADAFAVALHETKKKRTAFTKKASSMKDTIKKELASIQRVVVHEGKDAAPNILNVSFVGRDTDYLAALLNEAGFAVSTKSACETDATGSRVIEAYTGDRSHAAATLRISFHDQVRPHDIQRFIRALKDAVRFIDTG